MNNLQCPKCDSNEIKKIDKGTISLYIFVIAGLLALFFWWLIIPMYMLPIAIIGAIIYRIKGTPMFKCRDCKRLFNEKQINKQNESMS